MDVILLSSDLILLSRTQGAANKLGLSLVNFKESTPILEAVRSADCRGVIIDLRLPGLKIGALVPQLRAVGHPQLSIIACGPHVHETSLSAARDAKCDIVATRGQFDRAAEDLLQRCLAREGE